MIELFIALAVSCLAFMVFKLYQAKQYNKFIDWLNHDIKQQVLVEVENHLTTSRSQQIPNNDCHIKASLQYYQQYPIRIFQLACDLEIIGQDWLAQKNNKRFVSHLFAVQGQHRLTHNFPNAPISN